MKWFKNRYMGENDCKLKFYENLVILIKNVYDSILGFYEVWIKM